MSENKVVCFSSRSHIFLFLGFARDSRKKWINLRKLVLCLAALQGISQVHLSQTRTGHDTESLETLFSPSFCAQSPSARVGGTQPLLLGIVVDH